MNSFETFAITKPKLKVISYDNQTKLNRKPFTLLIKSKLICNEGWKCADGNEGDNMNYNAPHSCVMKVEFSHTRTVIRSHNESINSICLADDDE